MHDIHERNSGLDIKKKITKYLSKDFKAEEFEEIVNFLPVMVDSFDEDGRCLIWNDYCEKILGYTKADVESDPDIFRKFYPEQEMAEKVLAAIVSPDGKFREYEVRTKDGRTLTQEWANFKITNGMIISCGIDLTETREIEKQLKAERDKAEEANRAKMQFIAKVSHEIRTPLNGILGTIELLSGELSRDDKEQMFNDLKGCGSHLLAIVNDILDFSQYSSTEIKTNDSDLNLCSFVQGHTSLFLTLAKGKQIQLEKSVEKSLPSFVKVDHAKLSQIVSNLLSNAIKFTDNGKVLLTVKASKEKSGFIEFRVEDSGIGMSQNAIDKVFESFYQVENSLTQDKSGTGLGLAICKELAGSMGAEITATSELGRGSCFCLSIPLKAGSQTCDEKTKKPPIANECTEKISWERLKVLVVEDNHLNLKICQRYLSKIGVQADIAMHGGEAIEAAKQKKYDVILMDIHMPHINGLEATHRIRELPGHQPKILALTAAVTDLDLDQYAKEKMDGYLAKPVNSAKLKTTIEDLLLSTVV